MNKTSKTKTPDDFREKAEAEFKNLECFEITPPSEQTMEILRNCTYPPLKKSGH